MWLPCPNGLFTRPWSGHYEYIFFLSNHILFFLSFFCISLFLTTSLFVLVWPVLTHFFLYFLLCIEKMADVNTKSSSDGLNGEQPLQSLKDELPDVALGPTDSVPASPRPGSGAKKNPLTELFRSFAKFGDSKADGKAISLSQSDKWYSSNVIRTHNLFSS